jgi:hypothetical protein
MPFEDINHDFHNNGKTQDTIQKLKITICIRLIDRSIDRLMYPGAPEWQVVSTPLVTLVMYESKTLVHVQNSTSRSTSFHILYQANFLHE